MTDITTPELTVVPTTSNEFTLKQVAEIMKKSVDTIKAWRSAGKFPGAHKGEGINDPWMIPDSDVWALQATMAEPTPPSATPTSAIDVPHKEPEYYDELIRTKEALAEERIARSVAEARAAERQSHIDSLQLALRALPPGDSYVVEEPVGKYDKKRFKLFRR